MKNSISKLFLSSMLVGTSSLMLIPTSVVKAQESAETKPLPTVQKPTTEQMEKIQSNLASFDLTKKEKQEKVITLENGEKAVIGIEPVISENDNTMERASFHNVKATNGKFHAYWNSVVLNLSFYFDIKDLKIIRAYDASYFSIGVTVKSAKLKLDNSKQVSYYIEAGTPVWDFGGASGWLRAKISGDRVYFSIA